MEINLKEIEQELSRGLKNAENQDDVESFNVGSTNASKLELNVPKVATKLLCDIKNSIAIKIISKDMDEDTKEFVRDQLRTTDKEIILYQKILEQLGTDFAPEDYKSFLNKWLCSPIVLLIEHEIERMVDLRNSLKVFIKNKKVEAA